MQIVKKKKRKAGQTQQTNHKPLKVNNEVIEHTQKYYDVLSVLSIQRVGESVTVWQDGTYSKKLNN